MPIRRRTLLAAAASATALPAWADPAPAKPDPRMNERAIGKPDAPVQVFEYFSLTCTHCAAFAKEVFPKVRQNLVETGTLRYVFRDFPLDQVALKAAMVARALPPERYEPFVIALFDTQDRWAFARGVNSTDELAKMAVLAGMPRSNFDAVINDDSLKNAILAEQQQAAKQYGVDSTPSFIFNGAKAHDQKQSGELSYDAFAKIVTAAS